MLSIKFNKKSCKASNDNAKREDVDDETDVLEISLKYYGCKIRVVNRCNR